MFKRLRKLYRYASQESGLKPTDSYSGYVLRDSYEGSILKSGLIAQVECKKPNKSR